MALQVEEKQVGQQEVAVPGVVRIGALVAAAVQFAPVQAVVFDIVDDLQQGKGDNRLAEEEQGAERA